MDLFKIENDYVLHIIDIDTNLSAAGSFIRKGIGSNNKWDASLKCWALI